MPDVELTIKLPKTVYQNILNASNAGKSDNTLLGTLCKGITNGKLLKKGQWIGIDEDSAVCPCCNRSNVLYGDFCKWCGADMRANKDNK